MTIAQGLPADWRYAALAEVADINPKKAQTSGLPFESPVHFVPMAAVSEEFGGIDISATRQLGEVQKGYTQFLAGDVLFAKITPCMENGKGAIVPELEHLIGYGSTEFLVIRPNAQLRPKWLAYYLSRRDIRRDAQRHMTGSAGQLRVPVRWLEPLQIPLPSISDQETILSELDALLSDLDAGVANLKRAQANLKRYRSAVLKAAVEGRLTEAWRKQNPSSETGAQLLARILKQRRAKWEADQLAKFAKQGKAPPKGWQSKYVEPSAPDTTDLPELPEGWCWTTLDQLATLITSGSRGWAEFYSDAGAIFIRSQDINTDHLSLDNVAHVTPPLGSEGARTRVEYGDVLITITGANVAKCAWVTVTVDEVYVSQHVALLRLVDTSLVAFLHLALICEAAGRKQLLRYAYGAGKPGLNLQQVASVAIPLAPVAEQRLIHDETEEALSSIDATATEITRQLTKAASLRQAILKAAFSGKLTNSVNSVEERQEAEA